MGGVGLIQFALRQRERVLFMFLGAILLHMWISSYPAHPEDPADPRDPAARRQERALSEEEEEILEQTVRLQDLGLDTEHSHELPEQPSGGIDRSYGLDDGPDSRNHRNLEQKPDSSGKKPLKTIVFWNKFFRQDSYGLGSFGQGPFLRGGCKVNTCETTNDRSKMATADAVIVHGGYGIRVNKTLTLPQRTSPKQIFVFFEFEPPLLLRSKLDNLDGLFNMTFTYLDHPDTDIYAPYGIIHNGQKKGYRYKPLTKEALRGKTKQVAWMVSDCFPASKRMQYATELAKHINVDIYGKCGKDICPRDSLNCTKRIENDYKFYMAFENSVCDGYVTEKTFKMMFKHQLVPIVLGGANYTKHVPEKSVIDVRDYASPKHLAEYLLKLDRDEQKYLEYFEWKKHYYVETAPRIRGFCKLCEILHRDHYPYKRDFKVSEYWNPTKSCVKGMAEKRLIHLYGVS